MANNIEISKLSSYEAECSAIGGVLLDSRTEMALHAVEKLKPEHFYHHDCRVTWQAIAELTARDIPADLVTVMNWIEANGSQVEFSIVGAMARNTPSASNMRRYVDIIIEQFKLRDALTKCLNAISDIQNSGEPSARLASALSQVSTIGADETDSDIKDPVDVMSNVIDMMERAQSSKSGMLGISSGFENIDKFTNGFQAPDLIVVAAPPSMGKTTFSLNFAEHAAFLADEPKNVLIFSLEMSAEQLMQKTIANLGSLYLNKIKTGKALESDHDMGRLAQAQEIIYKRRNNFRIDDKGGQTIAELQARAKRTAMKMGGIDLIVVDYLHLIAASSAKDGAIETLTKNINGLKNLAKQLKCPVIVLSQLNRAFTGRPEMKNLLGSSIIEQAADIIFFLHDEDYQGQRGDHSITEVIVAKNRMGETGSTFLQPELGMSRFRDTQRLPAPPQEPEKKKTYSKGKFE